jgi:hypothetical protein
MAQCRDNHGKGRSAVKMNLSAPPIDAGAIQSVTVAELFL